MSASPDFYRERARDRVFWLAMREALKLMVQAIERRHLSDLRKAGRQTPTGCATPSSDDHI